MNAFDSFRSSFALRIALALSIAGYFVSPVSSARAQEDVAAPPAETAPDAVPEEAAPGDEQSPPDEPVAEDAPAAGLGAPVAAEDDPPAPEDPPAPVDPAPSNGDPIADDIAAETAAAAEPAAEEEAAEEEAAPAPEPSPFRGSLFSWQHGMTANTLDASAQLTYDPTYYQSFFLQGRYYLDRQNFLVLSQGLSIELTDAGYTTTQREPQLSDTTLEFRHIEVVEGFVFIPAARLSAPLSNWSQAADRILNVGAGLTIVKVFPELASFTIAATGAYRHWFASGTTVPFRDQLTCQRGAAANEVCGGAATMERDRLMAALTLTVMPLPGLTVLTQYAFAWAYGYEVAPVRLGETDYVDNTNHWRNFQYWTLAVGYDVVPWLNLQIGYQSASFMTALYNDDGSVRNPFYNPDAELFLSATLALDVFVDDVILGTEDEISPEQLQRRRQGLAGRSGVDSSF